MHRNAQKCMNDSEIDADPLENTWYSKKNLEWMRDSRGIRGNAQGCPGMPMNVKDDSERDADPLENAM